MFQCENIEDIICFILTNFVGKGGARYLIRQVPTKMSIVKFCLGCCWYCCQQNMSLQQITAVMFTNLISQYQIFGVENMALTDGQITSYIPQKIVYSKQIVLELLHVLYNLCSMDTRTKITSIIQRQCANDSQIIMSPL